MSTVHPLAPLWSFLVAHISEFWIATIGTFIVHEAVWLLLNAFYITLDRNKIWPQHKLQKTYEPIQKEYDVFNRLFCGHIFQLLPVLFISFPLLRFVGFTSATEYLPDLKTFAIQFLVFNVLEDTGFYWIHRMLHIPYWYNKVHYLHHQYTVSFSLVGEVAHPFEFVFNFLLPLMAGPFIMAWLQKVHYITYWLWMVFREIRSADAHSGYHLPYHPLRLIDWIYGGAVYHDFHHMVKGRASNYGGYKFWDWLMGTDAKFHQWKESQKKTSKLRN